MLSELYALGAPIERTDPEEGVLVRARLPHRDVRRFAPYLVASAGAATRAVRIGSPPPRGDRASGHQAPSGRSASEPCLPGDAGLDLAACERVTLAPGSRPVPTGLAVAIPGHAGFVPPRSGLAARHGITIVNGPGLIDSGYRGELKVILLNTDRSDPFTIEPGMRIAQLVVVPTGRDGSSRSTSCTAHAGCAASVRRRLMRPEPRIRVSAVLRWRAPPALPAREARAGALAAPRWWGPERRDADRGAPA